MFFYTRHVIIVYKNRKCTRLQKDGRDEYVYIDKFAAGGMSNGMVGGIFVKEALDVLCCRLRKYK